MFYIWWLASGYLLKFILFAIVVFEKGNQEAECPEAKSAVSIHPSFCYHDNIFFFTCDN